MSLNKRSSKGMLVQRILQSTLKNTNSKIGTLWKNIFEILKEIEWIEAAELRTAELGQRQIKAYR